MGLFSFIKNAGASIMSGFSSESPEEKAAKQADQIREHVEKFELEIEDLEVSVQDETVTLKGKANSQADKEKIVLAAGNVEGISSVEDLIEIEEPEPEAQFHTVVSGDTLGKIAKKFYGNAMKYPVIFEANKPMLKSPDLIYPGQVLRIPPIVG
ncbi:MAG: peptidoglycan-binding protein LysM [Bacteroidota bacterium]